MSFRHLERHASGVLERIARDKERAEHPQVRRIFACLEEHLFDPQCDISFIRRKAGASTSSIAAFKRQVGAAPKAYLTDCRLQVATRLLKYTRLRPGQVGNLVGYRATETFSQAMRRWCGMRPTQYRRHHKDHSQLVASKVTSPPSSPIGLPTGPARPDWDGKGARTTPTAGGAHDCFSVKEILRLVTRTSLPVDTTLHLLGGLAAHCPVCWGAVEEGRSALTFQKATGPEIELLRTLTLYPPEALPPPVARAARTLKFRRSQNPDQPNPNQVSLLAVDLLALLVEWTVHLFRDRPRHLRGELEELKDFAERLGHRKSPRVARRLAAFLARIEALAAVEVER